PSATATSIPSSTRSATPTPAAAAQTATRTVTPTPTTACPLASVSAESLQVAGSAQAWGLNANGEIGDGTRTDRHTPVHVNGLSGVVAVAAGWSHSLALMSDGTLRAWGYNGSGQLGDGTRMNRLAPVQVVNASGIAKISAGGEQSLALKSDGGVLGWGGSPIGQVGDGTTGDPLCQCRLTPVGVVGVTAAEAVAAGYAHSLALKSDGTVRAWGNDDVGQLGDGTTGDPSCHCRLAPVSVSGLSGVAVISGGYNHSL